LFFPAWGLKKQNMSIKTTHRICRNDAIQFLQDMGIKVFNSDSNERLADELEDAWDNERENYEVVDFDQEGEPEDDKWPYWK
jgi:hypothetical protein